MLRWSARLGRVCLEKEGLATWGCWAPARLPARPVVAAARLRLPGIAAGPRALTQRAPGAAGGWGLLTARPSVWRAVPKRWGPVPCRELLPAWPMNGRRVLGATKKVKAFSADGKLWGGSISEPGCWVQAPGGRLHSLRHWQPAARLLLSICSAPTSYDDARRGSKLRSVSQSTRLLAVYYSSSVQPAAVHAPLLQQGHPNNLPPLHLQQPASA